MPFGQGLASSMPFLDRINYRMCWINCFECINLNVKIPYELYVLELDENWDVAESDPVQIRWNYNYCRIHPDSDRYRGNSLNDQKLNAIRSMLKEWSGCREINMRKVNFCSLCSKIFRDIFFEIPFQFFDIFFLEYRFVGRNVF